MNGDTRGPKRVHTIVNAARRECVRHTLPEVSPFRNGDGSRREWSLQAPNGTASVSESDATFTVADGRSLTRFHAANASRRGRSAYLRSASLVRHIYQRDAAGNAIHR
jgi:hypothetical protein